MRIAVIGAGVAGLSAARELQALGHKVDIFEKSRGRSGRLATKRLDWGDADIGAQYFTARDPRFIQAVENWCRQGAATEWRFTPYKLGKDGLVPSPDSTRRYVGVPGMSSVAHALSQDLHIEFNLRILGMKWHQDHWYLLDQKEREWGAYNWVILALPPSQAQALLPESVATMAIPEQPLRPCWALVLGTHGRVPLDVQGFFGDEVVSWVSRLSSKPGRAAPQDCDDLWVLHFSPEWSRAQGKEAKEEVAEAGAAWLNNALDVDFNIEHEYLHFWRYAHLRRDTQVIGPLVNSDGRLALIGDWCCGGRVEGAYISALDLVERHFR